MLQQPFHFTGLSPFGRLELGGKMEMKKKIPKTLSFANLITYDLHYEKYDQIFVELMWYVMLKCTYALGQPQYINMHCISEF